MQDKAQIGILYSTTGPYGALGRDGWAGAQFAAHDDRASGGGDIDLVFFDAHADLAAYLEGARVLMREHGCHNIVGTITSSARKEVIPLVEKHDGLLWYTCPYEGFEANENVIYVAGTPNQHLIPLLEHLIPRHGALPYLLGANYVWGWEMNRLARELIGKAGGQVLGERYLPLQETAVERIVADIAEKRPSFILNNLIGPSSYAFLAALRRLADRDPHFLPENCPVASCDLTECELSDLEPGAAVGQLCALPYFDSLDTPGNRAFKARVQAWRPAIAHVSSIFASAYATVKLCMEAIRAAGNDDPLIVRRTLLSRSWPSVLGEITIDPATNHSALPFHLGRINADAGFDVVASKPAVSADPYLTGKHQYTTPRLRIVS